MGKEKTALLSIPTVVSKKKKLVYCVMGPIFKTKAVISLALLSLQEEEISMLGEITHLQTISDDLKSLTMDPHKLPSSSEQVSSCYLENIFICSLYQFSFCVIRNIDY